MAARKSGQSPPGFTLIELLVTITIIGMLAAASLGALQAARQTARESSTKALIAKLDHVISQRYNSYLTRRVRVDMGNIKDRGKYMEEIARRRLDAVRDLMRMELPERWSDVINDPVGGIPRPALSYVYKQQLDMAKAKHPSDVVAEFGPAECLYMIVATGSPEAMEYFSQREIGDADGDGLREFHDAWGRPIMFLRWAPGFTPFSEIQTGDPVKDHDPFDTRQVDPGAYHLIPLIYSGGRDKQYDLMVDYKQAGASYNYDGHPYDSPAGELDDEDGDGPGHLDNIHNHFMPQQ